MRGTVQFVNSAGRVAGRGGQSAGGLALLVGLPKH